MYNSGADLIRLCEEKDAKIYEIVLEKESSISGCSEEEIRHKMNENLTVMMESSKNALNCEVKSVGGLIGGDAMKMAKYANTENTICGSMVNTAMAKALSTSEINASMGKIVAAPTAGASGIIPAALLTTKEKFNLSEEEVINGLLTASGIGEIIAKNATVSGAYGGCQAECGVAAAMAASAIVEMLGGTTKNCLNAASFALINIMGLVCDPVAGLVEFPCALRNASGVVNALISADLALADVNCIIPFDEVVDAMLKVGKSLPSTLKETALGGLATTPTGEKWKRK